MIGDRTSGLRMTTASASSSSSSSRHALVTLACALAALSAAVLPEGAQARSVAAADKRAPFSSWAGKRSGNGIGPSVDLEDSNGGGHADLGQLLHDLHELYLLRGEDDPVAPLMAARRPAAAAAQKRAPFSSWAGKRAPFSSWAGKRAPFSSWAGKRAPFSSWAGKRSGESTWEVDDDGSNNNEAMMARHRFKRSSGEEEEEEENEGMTRQRRGASFSAWGGKRAQLRRFTRNVPVNVEGMVPVRVLRPQRAAFSAWGG